MDVFINTDNMNIRDLKAFRKLDYDRWKPLKCPLMDGEIVCFNKAGFYHLTHDGHNRYRTEADQRMRLNLLPYVRKVIKGAQRFTAKEKILPPEDNKFGKPVHFYEITRRFNEKKAISVVLRRIGDGGQLHYYSVRFYKKHGC